MVTGVTDPDAPVGRRHSLVLVPTRNARHDCAAQYPNYDGLLIDTFVVRTITVPALATMIGRANWWPSKPTAAKAIRFSDARKARSTSCLVGQAAIALSPSAPTRGAALIKRPISLAAAEPDGA